MREDNYVYNYVYGDSTVIPFLEGGVIGFAKTLQKMGKKLVIIATLDNQELREHPEAVAQVAEIHAFYPTVLDQIKGKPMFFSSIGDGITIPAGKIGDFISNVTEVAEKIDKVAIPKAQWDCGYKWKAFDPQKLAAIGLPANANRSMVKERCEELGMPELYSEFLKNYLENMAAQHGCPEYVNMKGELVAF